MQHRSNMKSSDPVFSADYKTDKCYDPLFDHNNSDTFVNREKQSSYFNNDSATNMDEKICAVIYKNNVLKKYYN